jgi:Ca2+-binding RTX toxin-like protein
VLSNGFVVVGWKEDFVHLMRQQAYNPAGFAAGTNYLVDRSVIEGEIAALTSGLVADVYTSAVPDQGGTGGFSVRHSIHELSRTILSDGASDTLEGDSLRDTLLGAGGNDLLLPGGANDFVDGGAGLDTVSYADATQTVVVDLPYHIALGAEIGTDTLANVENVITGSGNDAVAADGATNVLNGGAGIDTVSYYAAGGAAVDLAANIGVDPTSVDTLLNFENANGSSFDDAISATAAANVLNGLGGSDTVSYYLSGHGVTINLATGTANDGTSTDTLISIENANGSAFADIIIGDDGPNRLNGLGGADQLTGAGGDDTFWFRAGEANGDVVIDFSGNGAGAGDSFLFTGFGTAAQGATFTQIGATNQWQIHSGLDGHNEIITLANGAAVHASDFVFV